MAGFKKLCKLSFIYQVRVVLPLLFIFFFPSLFLVVALFSYHCLIVCGNWLHHILEIDVCCEIGSVQRLLFFCFLFSYNSRSCQLPSCVWDIWNSELIWLNKQAREKCFQNLHYVERHEEHTIANAVQTQYKKTKVFAFPHLSFFETFKFITFPLFYYFLISVCPCPLAVSLACPNKNRHESRKNCHGYFEFSWFQKC